MNASTLGLLEFFLKEQDITGNQSSGMRALDVVAASWFQDGIISMSEDWHKGLLKCRTQRKRIGAEKDIRSAETPLLQCDRVFYGAETAETDETAIAVDTYTLCVHGSEWVQNLLFSSK